MIVKLFIEPPIENNNYIIFDEESKESALIDCSAVDPDVRDFIQKEELKLKYILLTHGHFDHVAGIRENGIHVYMHKNDLQILNQTNTYLPMFGMPEITIPKIDKFVEDGETIPLGKYEIKVIHTPGHTQGGVCYYADGKLFSGDTLFRESVGRCDLEGGDFDQIVESIENKLYILPEDTEIYPGHGRPSTIGWEKANNKYL